MKTMSNTIKLNEDPREQICEYMKDRLPIDDLPSYLKKLYVEKANGGVRYIGLMNCKDLAEKGEFDLYIGYSNVMAD